MKQKLPWQLRSYQKISAYAEPLLPLFLWKRERKGLEDRSRIQERRGIPTQLRMDGALIWIHGASVGELLSMLPIVERLTSQGIRVLVTSGTRTSAKVVSERLPPGAIHQYMPLDAPTYVQRFLTYWHPDLALFAESELWPNFIFELKRMRIPLVLVNARMSDRSFARWSKWNHVIKPLLDSIPLYVAQSEEDARRFAVLGASHVHVGGNIKHDCDAPPADMKVVAQYSGFTAGRPVWVASSTHPGEDEIFLQTHMILKQRYPGLLTIIAPRHPDRGEDVAALIMQTDLKCVRRSMGHVPDRSVSIYIVDTLGELGIFYRLAPIVVMAGSFVPIGGHNPIEAIKLGAAVFHGPHTHNFRDLYKELDTRRGALLVSESHLLAHALDEYFRNPDYIREMARTGLETVTEHGGAINNIVRIIEPFVAALKLGKQGT